MNLHQRILASMDRLFCILISIILLGSTLSFGGAVWWFRPILVMTVSLLVLLELTQCLIVGKLVILKSPLTALGLLVVALGLIQLIPLPATLARRLSPTAHEVYSRGVLPEAVHADDAEAILPEELQIRSPATIDRSATLRWLVGALSCLGIFWAVSRYTDRLGRLYLVWGLVVAGFLINTAWAIVQVTHKSDGLYGLFVPGSGPSWTPSLNDVLESPTTAVLRNLADSPSTAPSTAKALLRPIATFEFGTMIGGSGAFLALGTLSLPLAVAILLHLVSPRGSRETLADRLSYSSQGSLVVLLILLLLIGAFLMGLIAGPWYCLPIVSGLAMVGLPALFRPGARGPAFVVTTLLLSSMGLGVFLQGSWPGLVGGQPPVQPPNLELAKSLWIESLQIIREFPLLGSGFGSFATIQPYFTTHDQSSSTAMSTLLQWGVESGAAGLGILGIGLLWCLIRLPFGLKRVGAVDRSLAEGLIGAALAFSVLAIVHWTVELTAVAISASALGGTWNRWLAGGTDLFVERG